MNASFLLARPLQARTKVAAAAVLLMAAGCLSTHPGSSNLAHVVIDGVSMAAIREATVQVFTGDHYQLQSSGESGLVFTREGSRQDQVRYGRYGESLHMRVEVTLEPYGTQSILVRADAYAVPGGSALGATKLLKITRRPYQKLLDRVQKLVLTP
jgi:hypothetical protein